MNVKEKFLRYVQVETTVKNPARIAPPAKAS